MPDLRWKQMAGSGELEEVPRLALGQFLVEHRPARLLPEAALAQWPGVHGREPHVGDEARDDLLGLRIVAGQEERQPLVPGATGGAAHGAEVERVERLDDAGSG